MGTKGWQCTGGPPPVSVVPGLLRLVTGFVRLVPEAISFVPGGVSWVSRVVSLVSGFIKLVSGFGRTGSEHLVRKAALATDVISACNPFGEAALVVGVERFDLAYRKKVSGVCNCQSGAPGCVR